MLFAHSFVSFLVPVNVNVHRHKTDNPILEVERIFLDFVEDLTCCWCLRNPPLELDKLSVNAAQLTIRSGANRRPKFV